MPPHRHAAPLTRTGPQGRTCGPAYVLAVCSTPCGEGVPQPQGRPPPREARPTPAPGRCRRRCWVSPAPWTRDSRSPCPKWCRRCRCCCQARSGQRYQCPRRLRTVRACPRPRQALQAQGRAAHWRWPRGPPRPLPRFRCRAVRARVGRGVKCRRRVCRLRSGVNGLRRSNGLPQGNNAHQVGACVNDGLAKVPALGGVVLSLRGGKRAWANGAQLATV